ncbi:hypothetical protein AMR41_12715 [Hapalosiphon sp. MRB220]|nr:hypothetical protein AMR41_12715 [Hapalosiphon sp. MRB220]
MFLFTQNIGLKRFTKTLLILKSIVSFAILILKNAILNFSSKNSKNNEIKVSNNLLQQLQKININFLLKNFFYHICQTGNIKSMVLLFIN